MSSSSDDGANMSSSRPFLDHRDGSLHHRKYDVVVVGSGSGGLTAAKHAVRWGARTLLVEKLPRLGGDCTWFGCVPSKALIRCARAAKEARTAHQFGVTGYSPESVKVDWSVVRRHVRQSQQTIYGQDDSPDVLRKAGVDVVLGRLARFIDENTMELVPVGKDRGQQYSGKNDTVRADRFILCTGAGPSLPPIQGLDKIPYLTYETIFEHPVLPSSLAVVGGGPIGSELAQAFARLGSKVTLVGTMLPREDEDVRKIMKQAFVEDGVALVGGRAEKVSQGFGGITLQVSGEEQIVAEALLVASGRRPKGLEALNLEAAGVDYDPDTGIQADTKLRTTASHIYAVGDCLGGLQFTHLSGTQGSIAALNALALPFGVATAGPEPSKCPRCTFTHPEVATVGLTIMEAKEEYGSAALTTIKHMSHVDRAVCEGETNGFIKVIHLENGKILGATVVAPVAGEIASELGLAIDSNRKLTSVGRSIHSYPTFSFGLYQLAGDFLLEYLLDLGPLQTIRRLCGRRLRGPR